MWLAAERLGFGGGTVVERAAGIGHFFGLAPEGVRGDSRFVGVERDPISARILGKLYPEATVFAKDTAEVKIPPGSVDLEITNMPFSANLVEDARYPVKLNLHNWFIAKMLDDLKPGGLLITVTSGHTMDSQAGMRQYLEDQFDSCWKCAKQTDPAPPPSVERLTFRHYAFALLMSYLVPWLAAFLGSWWDRYAYSIPFKLLFWDAHPDTLIWMLLPAGITFLALLPFLRYRLGRKAALVALCVMWFVLERPAMTKSSQ